MGQAFQTGGSAGVEKVAVDGLGQGQLALDAVETGGQNQPDEMCIRDRSGGSPSRR